MEDSEDKMVGMEVQVEELMAEIKEANHQIRLLQDPQEL